ncbi:hypothetical protein Nepgr_020233 [Nepenthes gracilis]|uniref:DUF7733 domain-containing protein n=1 Tax=Nepenthes gracilis TaxID=150966 RepID=A0AAD3SXS1_NEPGR|nr:hypothetical protein Nepgr_020233 [Nepenthes gracilis]
MSGGVGSISSDMNPAEENYSQKNNTQLPRKQIPTKNRFLSLRQLKCLAIIIVLAASGLVSLEDFAFVVFSLFYAFFLSKFAFPSLPLASEEPPIFSRNNKILRIYITVAAITGLYLPIAYIFEGIYEGDKEGIKAAAPHLFLLASQVFMEGVFFNPRFGIPVRAFIPVFYNSRRIFEIIDWLRREMMITVGSDGERRGSERRLLVGKFLAVANLVLWCYNLFGFLLPVYLPKALKTYYSKAKD